MGVKFALSQCEEHKLRVLKNRVLRRIFGLRRQAGEDCIMWNFITCMPYKVLLW
jgi:hypothetical protein